MKKIKSGLLVTCGFLCAISFSAFGAVNPEGTYHYDSIVGDFDNTSKMMFAALLAHAEIVVEKTDTCFTVQVTASGKTSNETIEINEEGIVCPADDSQIVDYYINPEEENASGYYFADDSLYMGISDTNSDNTITGYALFKKDISAEEEPANSDETEVEQADALSDELVLGVWEDSETGTTLTFKEDGTGDITKVSEDASTSGNNSFSFTASATLSFQWDLTGSTVSISISGVQLYEYSFETMNDLEILTDGTQTYFRADNASKKQQ